jgi:RNA polymerase sigma-70 factor (ECF subfamily)
MAEVIDAGAADTGILEDELAARLDAHRRELTAHCYRMLGSAAAADDAVQETMVRAWKSYGSFEGRSSLRSWLYRIATNVCLSDLDSKHRRSRPMEMGPSSFVAEAQLGPAMPEATWILPMPDSKVVPDDGDPAEVAAARDSIKLAFIAALQHLPPRQRAVLILREVLRWPAEDVAELLDSTVASVNSALQRARATLEAANLDDLEVSDTSSSLDEDHQALLQKYVEVFESYDMDAFVRLLHDDVVLSMPPYALWLTGPTEVRAWMEGPGKDCIGSRLVATRANGTIAFGQYRASGPNGEHEPWSLQVLELEGDKIIGFNAFLDTPHLFPMFGLPQHPDEPAFDPA